MSNHMLPYRSGVGMVVFNKQGKLWMGKRYGFANDRLQLNHIALAWQFPQGGVDEGESFLAAALRELYEETGMKSLKLVAEYEKPLCYDFPPAFTRTKLGQSFRGQQQHWLAFAFLGEDTEIAIDPPPNGYSPEFCAWQWVDAERALDKAIGFKKPIYSKVLAAFIPRIAASSLLITGEKTNDDAV